MFSDGIDGSGDGGGGDCNAFILWNKVEVLVVADDDDRRRRRRVRECTTIQEIYRI